MSVSFISVPSQQWIGTLNSASTFLCAGSDKQSQIVPVVIDWRIYPVFTIGNANYGVEVNMDAAQQVFKMQRIQSIYIDNIANPTPVYVWFPDTGFTVACGANQTGWMPVITNQKKAFVYGLGFIQGAVRQTTVYFCPFFVPPSSSLSSLTGGGVDPSPLNAVESYFLGSAIVLQNTASASQNFVFSISLGEEFAGRRILVFATVWRLSISVNNVQINGLPTLGADPMIAVTGAATPIGTSLSGNAYIKSQPTGASANFTINVARIGSTGNASCFVGVAAYSLRNLVSDNRFAVAQSLAANYSRAINVTVPARGALITHGACIPRTIATAATPAVTGTSIDQFTSQDFFGVTRFMMASGSDSFVIAENNWPISETWSGTPDSTAPTPESLLIGASFSPTE